MTDTPELAQVSPVPGDEAIIISDEWLERTKAQAIPGAYYDRVKFKAWVVENPTPRAAAVTLRLFPHLADTYPELTVLRDTLLTDARPFDNATPAGLTVADHAPIIRGILASTPCARCSALLDGPDPECKVCGGDHDHGNYFPFQNVDLGYIHAVLKRHESAEIAWERGLGKTLGACSLIEASAADRIMVVGPNTSKEAVWLDEVRRFLPDHEVVIMPNGNPEKRAKVLQHVGTTLNKLVFVCHYEALDIVAQTRSRGQGWHRLPTWDIVVADESHRLANPKTKQHKALMKVPTNWKLSLTGSMIQNHPEEFYGRLRWLFPDLYRSKWRDWNDRYLEYVESGYGKVLIGPNLDCLDEMREELGVFTVYRRKADELDLPPKNEQTVYLDLGAEQRAAYDELARSYVATLDSGEHLVAVEPVVLLTRLRQLATGLDLVSRKVTGSTKLDWTVDAVRSDPDSAFVCFSWFKPAAEALAEKLRAEGEDVHVVTGDTTHKQRRDRIRDFQDGKGGRVFIGTIATLGESVNLHRANRGIFIDQSWNPAQNDQASDRYFRIGQTRPVLTQKLVAKDTVDQYNVLPKLNDKIQIRRMITGGK